MTNTLERDNANSSGQKMTDTHTHNRPWVIVMKRELVVRGLSKAFIISTVVMIAMFALSGAGSYFGLQSSSHKIAVTDDTASEIITLKNTENGSANIDSPWKVVHTANLHEAQSALKKGTVDAVLSHDNGEWTYIVKEYNSDAISKKTLLSQLIKQYTLSTNASATGIDVDSLMRGSDLGIKTLDAHETPGQSILVYITAIIISAVFYFFSLTYGLQIAQSVVEEKQSRIVEILISTIRSKDLILGKILGISILAFVQLALFSVMGFGVLSFMKLSIPLPTIGAGIGWFAAFFILGFLALNCIWAGLGAMVMRQEDLNQASSPLIILLIFVLAASFAAKGAWITILSYVPIVSVPIMPKRIISGQATWWEALISIAITCIFSLGAIRVGGAIYRKGIMSNHVLKFKDLLPSRS